MAATNVKEEVQRHFNDMLLARFQFYFSYRFLKLKLYFAETICCNFTSALFVFNDYLKNVS